MPALAVTDRLPQSARVTLNALRDHVREKAHNRPGVYRMLGPGGELIYVGKSIQVRTRLLSYFRADRGEKAAEIIKSTERLEWEYVPSEFASLLLELNLIRRHRPRFNWEHKHERSYCFVKLTREAAPRLLQVNHAADDRSLYYGPFTGRQRVREAVRELCDVMQLRDCGNNIPMKFADQYELFVRDDPPRCLRGDLQRCLAPCAGRCHEHQYLDQVELARRFLEGDADHPISILHTRMDVASQRMHFEYAAELRDRAERLREVRDSLVALRGSLDNLSFVYHVPGYAGDDRLYLIRRGTIRADVAAPRTKREGQQVAKKTREVFSAPEPALAGVPPHKVAEILLIARWFRLNPDEAQRAFGPEQTLRL